MVQHEGFTDEALAVMRSANEDAAGRGHDHICLRDMVTGLISCWASPGGQALEKLGLTHGGILSALESLDPRGAVLPLPEAPFFDSEVVDAIMHARNWSVTWTDKFIGTEHLLLGILSNKSLVVTKLNEIGVTLEKAGEAILDLRHRQKQSTSSPRTLEERVAILEEQVRRLTETTSALQNVGRRLKA